MNFRFKSIFYGLIIVLSASIAVESAIAGCKKVTKTAGPLYYQLKKEGSNDFYVWFSVPTNATDYKVKGKTSDAKSTLKKAAVSRIGSGTVRVIAGGEARFLNYYGTQNELKRFANDIFIEYKVCK